MADERRATVARVVSHAPDVQSLFLTLAEPLHFTPGHFVSCKLPAGDDLVTRAYSIASHPTSSREIEILLSLVPGGPGSSHLFGLAPGDPLSFTGPWGTFILERQPAAETLFGLSIRHDLLLVDGVLKWPKEVFRKVVANPATSRLDWSSLPD